MTQCDITCSFLKNVFPIFVYYTDSVEGPESDHEVEEEGNDVSPPFNPLHNV